MGTVQHSIEVKVPVHTAYDCLSDFEAYPHFMEDVEDVRRVDANHLHWVTRMDNHPVEWQAEITEEEIDQCIAWHNVNGPGNSGKLELQALDDANSRITFTWHLNPEQVPGPKQGESDKLMAQRLQEDMARMKDFIEAESPTSLQDADADGSEDSPKAGGTAGLIGALGGTDASAGAALSGSKTGGPGGSSPREMDKADKAAGSINEAGEVDNLSPGAGAYAAGGTGLGSAASAADTRTGTGTGTASGGASAGRVPGGKPGNSA